MPRYFSGLILLLAIIAFGLPARAQAQGISVSGTTLTKDGQPWIPLGFSLVSIVAPPGHEAGGGYATARHLYGPQLFNKARSLGANTLRLQVSQPGLDPSSSIYDPRYLDEIMDAVQEARRAGFVVIVSMQWEKPAGLPNQPNMPSASTERAWAKLAPALANDNYVMLELFNEPAMGEKNPRTWLKWQNGMQALVNQIRQAGNRNLLVLDGIRGAHVLNGAPPIMDPFNKLAYAVHPYFGEKAGLTPQDWDREWGQFAESHPVFVSEWNALSSMKQCAPQIPQASRELINYIGQRHMGLIIWALDLPGTVFGKNNQLLGFKGFACGIKGTGAAHLAVKYFRTGQ